MSQRDMTFLGHPTGSAVVRRGEGTMATYRVVVVCPQPRHEFTVTVDPDADGDPAGQAGEIVFALLNIGCGGIDDLPHSATRSTYKRCAAGTPTTATCAQGSPSR